ncbi:hypothetical protein QJQ45_002613 [Haematococcus lacustris]|nr:hypothetical protein QJQ45_002613 [Haematococcus lacustris]
MCKMLIDTMDAPTVAAAGAELQLPFLFCGRYGGKPCRVMMDTGATHSILSKEWLDKQKNPMLTRHILERPLNLLTANNDTVHIREQFVGPLEIQKSKVGCFAKIMPGMLAGVDLILGADWLSYYDAVLKPKHGVCTLQATNSGKPENLFALRPKHLPGFAAVAEMEKQRCKEAAGVLSAGQTARLLRQGCSSWLMLVQPGDGNDKEGWHTGSLAAAVVGSEGARSAEVNPWLVPAAQLEGLLAEFADVFESMPEGLPPDRKVGHTIRLEPGAVPPYRRMYKLSPREDAEVRKQVAELLAKGLIEPSSSPYGAPILFVQKKDGTLRMCIDYRALNKLTVRDRYPLPRIDELFDKLAGKKVFSSLDLQAGYHQIRITEEDVPKTAFLTPVGQFQFKVLCFGLTNAPATFQRVMNTVFKPLINKSVLVYIDDILVMSNTPEEHLVHLREVLQLMREHKLYAKMSKCEFNQPKLVFLGHIVGGGEEDLVSARLLPNASPGAPKRTTQHADLAEARLHARPRAQPGGEEDLASARLLPNASPGARSSQADHPPKDLASARLLPPARPGAQPGGGEALQRTTPQPTTSKQGEGKPGSDPLTLLQAIRSAYDDDERFNNEAYTSQLHRLEGLWLTENGKVVVPNSKPLRQRVMRTMHDNQAAGHLGVSKTLDQVTRWFDWAGVSEDVRHYVRNCHSCQVNKASSLKPAGKLQPLPIPLRAWDSVSMDLIVKLPASGPQKYDSILVFVDRLTKMVHLVKTWESITAPQYAKLFIEHVFRLHGMPRDVISDRGPQFKNHFWAEVAKLLRVQVNLSSAYHPQTDGQTERMNRVVEEMLRHYIRPDQRDWADHLPLVEFAINNARQESTRFTPFYLNYGYHPRRAELLDLPQKVPRAHDFVLNIRRAVEQARLCLEKAQKRQKVYADGKRRHATFAPGDMVLLSTQNMRGHSAQPGVRKLKPRYVGPFEVQYMVGEAAVKLELPQQWSRFHNVFHVSLVKPYRSDGSSAVPGVSSPPPEQWLDGEPVYTVERVLDHRLVNTGKRKGKDKKSETKKPRLEFLVKWQGYGDEHNTWEPRSQLTGCQELLRQYAEECNLGADMEEADDQT